jgi:hypothetical protein
MRSTATALQAIGMIDKFLISPHKPKTRPPDSNCFIRQNVGLSRLAKPLRQLGAIRRAARAQRVIAPNRTTAFAGVIILILQVLKHRQEMAHAEPDDLHQSTRNTPQGR